MNWIERHIILVLLRQQTATLKVLRPPNVAANLFSYHLGNVIRDGFIVRPARGVYKLTPTGQKLAGTFSTKTDTQIENVKTVVMIASQDIDSKLLLFRWSRQPYWGYVTPPHDRMVVGRPLREAIQDVLKDKCGLPATTLRR